MAIISVKGELLIKTSDLPNNAVAFLRQSGAIGVLPTDTVYGVVARATDKRAVARLYELKKREAKPGTIIAAHIGQLETLGLDKTVLNKANRYWPGPVSVIIPARQEATYLHQGKGSIAARIPNDKKLLKLLENTGPLLTSSANHPGEPPANTIDEARNYFGNKVDFYIDGGNLSGTLPSTVLSISGPQPIILRQGVPLPNNLPL